MVTSQSMLQDFRTKGKSLAFKPITHNWWDVWMLGSGFWRHPSMSLGKKSTSSTGGPDPKGKLGPNMALAQHSGSYTENCDPQCFNLAFWALESYSNRKVYSLNFCFCTFWGLPPPWHSWTAQLLILCLKRITSLQPNIPPAKEPDLSISSMNQL